MTEWLYNTIGTAAYLMRIGWTSKEINALYEENPEYRHNHEHSLIRLTDENKKIIYDVWYEYYQKCQMSFNN